MSTLNGLLSKFTGDFIKKEAKKFNDDDPIDADNCLFKLRCRLTSGNNLQIRLRATQDKLNSTVPLQRWDNAPHFPYLAGFPHHYHSPQGRVLESPLTGDPISGLPIVLEALETE